MRLERERLKRAIPWQAAVLGMTLSLFAALVFVYKRDWVGVGLVILADIAFCVWAYSKEGRNQSA